MYKDYRANASKMATSKNLDLLQSSLGEKVIRNDGTEVEVKSLFGSGKVLGLYFSAHRCPPCRQFTPQLAEFYKELRKKAEGKDFEIVFLSSDRSDTDFNGYFEEMPWLAMPHANRAGKDKLSKKFKVSGIPTLIIIDGENGDILTANGRSKVSSDSKAKDFPWRPPPFSEVIAGKLVNKDSKEVDVNEAFKDGKSVGIYFSAHWCPPCRGFTPKLVEFYNKFNAGGKKLEIIFVSWDRDEKGFKEYMDESSMPWLAITPDDERKEKLNEIFEVEGIPHFSIINEKGEVLCADARSKVMEDPEGKEFPWPKKSVEKVDSGAAAEVLGSETCLVHFPDNDDVKESMELLKETADKEFIKEDQELFFFTAPKSGELTQRLRDYTKMSEKCCLAIIDMSGDKLYESADTKITKESVADLVDKFQKQCLVGKSFKG